MASEAQVLANRRNAQKSTGPRTAEGKAAVSQNAVKHGLLGREAVIRGEDAGEFEFYRERMLAELDPVGQIEAALAERVVSLSWRLRRAERLQNEAFESMYAKQLRDPFTKDDLARRAAEASQGDGGTFEGDLVLGRMVVRDFADYRVLDRLLMYERRIELSLYKTMAELQKRRLLREAAHEVPVEASDAGSECVVLRMDRGEGCCVPEEVGRGRPTCEETPHGVTTSVPVETSHHFSVPPFQPSRSHAPSCKTKPICPVVDGGQALCGKEVRENPSQSGSGGTNPISQARSAGQALPAEEGPSEGLGDFEKACQRGARVVC